MRKIIHIGYLKTATTWFQTEYFPKVENIHYIKPASIMEYIIPKEGFPLNEKMVREKLIPNTKNIIVVSQENLLGKLFTTNEIRLNIAKRLKEIFENATIIIFVRNQFDLIASIYSMHLKHGGTRTLTNFLFGGKETGFMFPFEFLKFNNPIIDSYKELFGRDNIKFYCYEEFENDPKKFLTQFAIENDLQINLNKLNLSKSNIRLKPSLVKPLRFVNHFTKRFTKNKNYYIHIPGWYNFSQYIFESFNNNHLFEKSKRIKDYLGLENYSFIENYYAESNREFSLEFPKILDYNYPKCNSE